MSRAVVWGQAVQHRSGYVGHRLYLGRTSHPCKCLLVHDDANLMLLMYWCPEPLLGTKQWVLGPRAASWQNFSSRDVQLSSVQGGIYALRKAHMRSTPSLRSSLMLPLKWLQCSSDWQRPSLVLSRKII